MSSWRDSVRRVKHSVGCFKRFHARAAHYAILAEHGKRCVLEAPAKIHAAHAAASICPGEPRARSR
jgi:hypothetical protein